MKRIPFIKTVLTLTAAIGIAQAAPSEDLAKAIKKLADADNYSWKTTTEGARFGGGPIEGKAGQDGLLVVSMTMRDNPVQMVRKGDSGAMETDDGWQSLAELEADPGDGQFNRGRFMAMMVRNLEAPAVQAEGLLKTSTGLAMADGVYAGKLTEDGVKALLTFRRGGGGGPDISNAKGSVKFWVKDGALAKYEYQVQGSMSFNNNDFEVDRTTTVEIANLGSTKVEVPAAAKSKL